MNPRLRTPKKLAPLRTAALVAAVAALTACQTTPLGRPDTRAPAQSSYPAFSVAQPVTVEDLADAVVAERIRVREFPVLAQLARERGLRLFLFGGSAANYAHYVKWNLERRRGDSRYLAAYFNFDYMRIFRSNQDMDMVVSRADGSPESVEEIREFQRTLETRFPYFVGNKSQWEVRGLRTANGDKEALLDNPDFENQHSDSQSTGLIEITEPPPGESAIRDLRDLAARHPQFLRDVANGQIHFYFSDRHETTARALRGENPPILGALRVLRKSFQYGIALDEVSRAHVARIARTFDPTRPLHSYARKRIESEARKCITNAIDIELAWDTLESLRLREKLVALGDASQINTAAWLLNREPLRSQPSDELLDRLRWNRNGRLAPGRSAAELGLTLVTHATKTLEAYDSITRSPIGKANFLISRQGAPGESASSGNSGLYTASGSKGRGIFDVRLAVDPEARENVDFLYGSHEIIWSNASRLRVVPESLEFTFEAALAFLREPGNRQEHAQRAIVVRWLSTQELPAGFREQLAADALALAPPDGERYPRLDSARLGPLLEISDIWLPAALAQPVQAFRLVGALATTGALASEYRPFAERFVAAFGAKLSREAVYAIVADALARDDSETIDRYARSCRYDLGLLADALREIDRRHPEQILRFAVSWGAAYLLYPGLPGFGHDEEARAKNLRRIEPVRQAVFTSKVMQAPDARSRFIALAKERLANLPHEHWFAEPMIHAIFSNPLASGAAELVDTYLAHHRDYLLRYFSVFIERPEWRDHPRASEWMTALARSEYDGAHTLVARQFADPVLAERFRPALRELAKQGRSHGRDDMIRHLASLFAAPHGRGFTNELRLFVESFEWQALSPIISVLRKAKRAPPEWKAIRKAAEMTDRKEAAAYLAKKLGPYQWDALPKPVNDARECRSLLSRWRKRDAY